MARLQTFITGTGTGVGKSFITAGLVAWAKRTLLSVAAYKPIISGFDPAQVAESDTGVLLQSLGLAPTPENIERVSPWRFQAPLAPSMAAKPEQRTLDFDGVVAHSRKVLQGQEDVILIEGVGGVMVPLDERRTVLDWIAALEVETILVAGSYLGTLSHTLTALAALQQRNVKIRSLVISESENATVSLRDTVEELRRWTPFPIIPVRRYSPADVQNVQELRSLLK